MYVRDQLSLGGAKLFQFIARLDKAFFNVSWDTHSSSGDPESFLREQMDLWAGFWNPTEFGLDQKLATEFKHLWLEAKTRMVHEVFDASTLEFALKGYRKETIGVDIWKPSELRHLPLELKETFAEAV